MTLNQITKYILQVCDSQPNVNLVDEGDVYRILNDPKSEKYTAIVLTPGIHQWKDDFTYWDFTLFYVDRLIADLEKNRLQIQSTGIEVVKNCLRTICNGLEITVPPCKITQFSEKFNSMCAGVYFQFRLEIPDDYICEELYEDE